MDWARAWAGATNTRTTTAAATSRSLRVLQPSSAPRTYYEALQMKRLPTIRTRRPRKLRAMALTMLWVIDRRAGLRLGPLRD
jgi:hypothetical protein